MRKHKNLNKQELMIRQDIPCVHLGGKFVPLKSRVKSLLGEKRKKRAEKVLATVVMGMNLVNVTAPVAALAAAGKRCLPQSSPCVAMVRLWITPCCPSWQT